MVSSAAPTVAQYLASLPPDRRAAIAKVRDVVGAGLPAGYVECMQYGMIAYVVPLARFPRTYNGQPLAIVSLASQKQYMTLYLLGIYGDPVVQRWFVDAYAARGKRLDMGKSCVRFRTLDDLPLDVIAQVVSKVSVDAFIAQHEAAHAPAARAARSTARTSAAAKQAPAKKTPAKKHAAAKKTPAKKPPAKKAAKKPPAKRPSARG